MNHDDERDFEEEAYNRAYLEDPDPGPTLEYQLVEPGEELDRIRQTVVFSVPEVNQGQIVVVAYSEQLGWDNVTYRPAYYRSEDLSLPVDDQHRVKYWRLQ